MSDLDLSRPWVGANFWSRRGGPRMWGDRYDGAVVREELAVLADHGCNVTRSFCYWPDFVPEPERLDSAALARFADFLDAHVDAGLGTIPTLIVGHMSGQNWDPAWRDERDLYRDVWFVGQQAWLAEEMARRFHDHPAVAAWLLTNEMPIYGGKAEPGVVSAWARLVVQALRAGGATQPISVGDGAWGIEVTGDDNGFSLRQLEPIVDFFGPHVYPMSDDTVRQHLAAAFACELAATLGRPVVLEEFGVSSDFASEAAAACYYRQVLHTSLLAGSKGWIGWCNTDFDDLAGEDPYRHHPFEMHFGLTDMHGKPKAALAEVARFSRLVGRLASLGWGPVPADVRLVVPEHFEQIFPFTTSADRADMRAHLLQGYIAAKEADLPVAPDRERDGFPDLGRLYLAPSCRQLTAPGTARLASLAEQGATVYLSFFAGSSANQRGPWVPWLDSLFGVRQQLSYGLVERIEDDEVVLEVQTGFGGLDAGERLSFATAGNEHSRAYLPVKPAGAEVLAVDGQGRPALLRRRVGAGAMVLCTYPVEHMAARRRMANPEATWRLYSALAAEAGVRVPVRVDDPRVSCGRLRVGDAEVAVVVNLSADELTVELVTEVGLSTWPYLEGRGGKGGGTGRGGLRLRPFDVAAVGIESEISPPGGMRR